ncbi:hypothetical protein GCM10011415_08850 [Salipiger pallidus]|uniref:Uncharacterized protein n=1 Tax=Salipiger pallidus TaxID=1775170 RepID=A0A8J2ZHU0_9RHOB|nr:hypothetical protein [Salipiger pallidus]GGG64472.1 hypothetical protein GCM10011415_08850 [Salipiger pallidus]
MGICSGLSLVTVIVDENGEPASHVHVCPDGLTTLFVSVGCSDMLPLPDVAVLVRVQGREATKREGRDAPTVQAREPPVLV